MLWHGKDYSFVNSWYIIIPVVIQISLVRKLGKIIFQFIFKYKAMETEFIQKCYVKN